MISQNNLLIFHPQALHPAGIINERGLEMALAQEYLSKAKNPIEIGACTPYYFKETNYPIIDPFDPYPNCIKLDAEQFNFTGYDVLCISTIEHMGKLGDYGNTDDDPFKPIRFLDKLTKESSTFFVTFPIGSNKILDDYLLKNPDKYNIYFYVKLHQSPPLWCLTHAEEQVLTEIKYNDPFPNGNAICCIYK